MRKVEGAGLRGESMYAECRRRAQRLDDDTRKLIYGLLSSGLLELGIIDWKVVLHLVQLDGEAYGRAVPSHSEGHFDSVYHPVILQVNLKGYLALGSLCLDVHSID